MAVRQPPKPIDYQEVNRAAIRALLSLLQRWLPGGRVEGREFVALNPKRADQRPGSFKINLQTGRWADFATDDKGGDVISLAAFLFSIRQSEAARRMAIMLGLEIEECR